MREMARLLAGKSLSDTCSAFAGVLGGVVNVKLYISAWILLFTLYVELIFFLYSFRSFSLVIVLFL